MVYFVFVLLNPNNNHPNSKRINYITNFDPKNEKKEEVLIFEYIIYSRKKEIRGRLDGIYINFQRKF